MAEIRSSMSGVVHHTADTEKLCERISSVVTDRWESVRRDTDGALPSVADWLLTSDQFRVCIDNVLVKMDNVRDDIVELDVGRDVLHQTHEEKQTRLQHLDVCIFITSLTRPPSRIMRPLVGWLSKLAAG